MTKDITDAVNEAFIRQNNSIIVLSKNNAKNDKVKEV